MITFSLKTFSSQVGSIEILYVEFCRELTFENLVQDEEIVSKSECSSKVSSVVILYTKFLNELTLEKFVQSSWNEGVVLERNISQNSAL